MDDIVKSIQRAYYDAVYGVTKAALEPVVAATNDVLREAVCEAFRQGMRDAFSPTERIGDFLFGRKRK
jgi:hypothetical protein